MAWLWFGYGVVMRLGGDFGGGRMSVVRGRDTVVLWWSFCDGGQ